MKYLIIFFGCLLLNGCGCLEYDDVEKGARNTSKNITIVNHTDKTYTNNSIYSVSATKKKEKNATWKLYYKSAPYSYPRFKKISIIKPKEKGKPLEISNIGLCSEDYEYSNKAFFVFSLDGGERKIAFGFYTYQSGEIVYGEKNSDCKRYFSWDIHPVWQEKKLTIHIWEHKITFSDPKIKEVKKLKARENNEEIELKDLEIVPCDEE